ncbi:unnamed protein product [Rotaria magnacalcarata]|uniref:Tc1-like transposase DDE domain-containing protein n=1 Tax=Rotaria magnacalcarata TaxID=392030 RepID=A0A819NF67_9BILA|nr:unnamed protein product [Rotaria magnacalcarata]
MVVSATSQKKDKLKLPLENRPGQGRKNARTVRRRLFNAGYKSYTTKRKPYRKPSHCSARLKLAKQCSDWNFSDWKTVIFSDESHFEVFNRKNKSFVRRLPSESDKPFNFQPRVQGGGGSISVCGIMTAKGVGSLAFYDGHVTCYYVQDNAPCHKSAFSMKWLKKNKINLLDWPAVSPDFNAIENLWDIIDNKLNDYRLNNVNDLQQAILEIWTKISNETCDNLVWSMPRRIKKCVCVKGNTSAKY